MDSKTTSTPIIDKYIWSFTSGSGKWTTNPDYVEPPKTKITPKKPKLKKGGCSICDDPDCPANKGDIEIQPKKPKLKIKTYQVEQLNIKAIEKERLIIDDGLFEIIRKI